MSRETVQHELSEGPQRTLAMAEASRFCLRLIGGVVSLALLWIVFSWLVVPAVIESAYRGGSLPFLNDIISGQAIHPVEHYLASWETISWRLLGVLSLIGITALLFGFLHNFPGVENFEDAYPLGIDGGPSFSTSIAWRFLSGASRRSHYNSTEQSSSFMILAVVIVGPCYLKGPSKGLQGG